MGKKSNARTARCVFVSLLLLWDHLLYDTCTPISFNIDAIVLCEEFAVVAIVYTIH